MLIQLRRLAQHLTSHQLAQRARGRPDVKAAETFRGSGRYLLVGCAQGCRCSSAKTKNGSLRAAFSLIGNVYGTRGRRGREGAFIEDSWDQVPVLRWVRIIDLQFSGFPPSE